MMMCLLRRCGDNGVATAQVRNSVCMGTEDIIFTNKLVTENWWASLFSLLQFFLGVILN
jgi:hypothetical protein